MHDGVGVLDLAHDGKVVGRLRTGGGVDDIVYDTQKRRLFVASSKNATLTIANVSESGAIEGEATLPTAQARGIPSSTPRGRCTSRTPQAVSSSSSIPNPSGP